MICVPIKEKTVKSLLENLAEANKTADIIEVWFDELGKNLADKDIQKIFKNVKKPIIYKTSDFPALHVFKILRQSPAFIDIDVKIAAETINYIKNAFTKTKIILSYHNFRKTPPAKTLQKIIREMDAKGASIFKLATQAQNIEDSLRMLRLLGKLSSKLPPKKKIICLCMGKHGIITRTAGHLFGNYLMYAPLKPEDKTAKGQVPAKKLAKIQSLITKICR